MILTLYLICVLLFLVSTAMSVIDSMHFFQLNSYRFDTHTKWLRENHSKYLPHAILSVMLLIVVMVPINITVKLILLAVLFAITIKPEMPKKAKKPLVYTARVKRMLATLAVLVGIIVAAATKPCFMNNRQTIAAFILVLLYAFSPLLVLLANLINKPV